ncbi:MAG: helicase [Campylobacterales bacterium]|nr:helicase [Campylobacterales bacterium]
MSKKNAKINQKIKKYFDDDPFDVGVERVESQTLSEMFHYLGIHEVDYSKSELVKLARMIWSEADSHIRKEILNFFIHNKTIYKSDKPKEPSLHHEEKLDLLLDDFDVTKEEMIKLHSAFAEVRAKKITHEKIEKKLKHIRQEEKKERVEKSCKGSFEDDESFEFNAFIHYVLYGQSFHKIEVLKTKPYDYEFLDNEDADTIIQKVEDDKEVVRAKRQKEVEKFIKHLKIPHAYLTTDEIVSSLRSSPPNITKYPLIKEEILKKIISDALEVKRCELLKHEYLIALENELELPFSDKKFSYILELHIELQKLLEKIWCSEKLDFEEVLQTSKQEQEEYFLAELNSLATECNEHASLLHLKDDELYKKIYPLLFDLLGSDLIITPKIKKKVFRRFLYEIQDEIAKKQKEALLARTIRDFKNLFPLARNLRRKLTLHIGPTNSGKTYTAMQKLEAADTGYYLAPLRLLALEGYENLKEKGLDVSLITGEEQLLNEDATHISSTIEMLNFAVDVDVCIIDEVQMIDDADRGWAWANAIIGAPASEVIMTGSPNCKNAIIALAEYLGEELEIVEFERKNPLKLLDIPTDASEIKKGSAIIAFSRKDVLKLREQFASRFLVSVIYGNLSPEVRREEARRFRDGETNVLVATDAIAMGLNLPIKTILFSASDKFDGITQRDLTPSEIAQISGRAGRYGLEEVGYVGALHKNVYNTIKRNFNKPAKEISVPFKVMANIEHIKLVSNILEENSLWEVLNFFSRNMVFDGPFYAANLDDMLEAAKIVDNYKLDITTKYHLACAPLTLKSPYIVQAYEGYILALEKKMPVIYELPKLHGSYAKTSQELLLAEDMVKEISLYLWLSYRFKDYFLDEQKARSARGILNKYIEKSLAQEGFVRSCKICGVPLPKNSKYSICQHCFKKHYKKGRDRIRR